MSGILDSKKRILDVVLTEEGRKQVARGDLRIDSYSFSDAGTYYRGDIASGSADATVRLQFESSNLPQDSITFESNDDGRLLSFKNSAGIQLNDGSIIEFTTSVTSSATFLKGSEFTDSVDELLVSSIGNFNKLQLLATRDNLFDDSAFGLSSSAVEFLIKDDSPIEDRSLWTANVNNEESLFNDPRLARSLNFRYLPPSNGGGSDLGTYPPLGTTNGNLVTYEQLKVELDAFEQLGLSKTIKFDPTSRENNLFMQFFEQNYNQLSKLRIIDFGKFRTSTNSLVHVFFAGNLFVDDKQSHTFSHVFTMVFS